MKTTKRMLSIALALVLALGLVVPAMAAETEAANPNAPVITRQPNIPARVRSNGNFVLEVQAELPEGTTSELSFTWFHYGPADAPQEWDVTQWQEFASGARVEVDAQNLGLNFRYVFVFPVFDGFDDLFDNFGEFDLFMPGGVHYFYVVVSYICSDSGETHYVTSDTVRVFVDILRLQLAALYWRVPFAITRFLIPNSNVLAILFGTFLSILMFPMSLWQSFRALIGL